MLVLTVIPMKAQVIESAPVQPIGYFEAAERRPNKEVVLLSGP